jgi:hypothetical protein
MLYYCGASHAIPQGSTLTILLEALLLRLYALKALKALKRASIGLQKSALIIGLQKSALIIGIQKSALIRHYSHKPLLSEGGAHPPFMAAWSKELLVSAPATKNTLDAYPSVPIPPEHGTLDTPPPSSPPPASAPPP